MSTKEASVGKIQWTTIHNSVLTSLLGKVQLADESEISRTCDAKGFLQDRINKDANVIHIQYPNE
jgi:hypothetical protein